MQTNWRIGLKEAGLPTYEFIFLSNTENLNSKIGLPFKIHPVFYLPTEAGQLIHTLILLIPQATGLVKIAVA